ncbi:hypothetical protein HAZT_HAZT010602 [Hyalella azteca]|uniref:Uncharacterized protein n=1 Tax=Hyalella azteca TaxID=294128 RepID=A0A6A0HAM0_HYAAZ|nr:hypothetical protein HAZT_HAZT010602 [Hyalella azteca]
MNSVWQLIPRVTMDVATSEKRLPLLNPAPLAAPHNKTSERKTAKRVSCLSTTVEKDQKLSFAVTELSGELLKLSQTQASAFEAKTSVTRAANSARDAANAFLVAWHSGPSVMLECYSKYPVEGRTESRDKKKRKLSELFGEDRDEEAKLNIFIEATSIANKTRNLARGLRQKN